MQIQQLSNSLFDYRIKDNWSDYDLQTYTQYYDQKPTNLQAVTYKGNFIAFRNINYHVFPHEDLFATIHPVMEKLGGVIQKTRNENASFSFVYGKNQKADIEANHKYFNGKKYYLASQVRANYTFADERFDVTGSGDIVNFGVSVANAIDGTMSLSISPYSFRQTCSNGALHVASAVMIGEHAVQRLMKQNNIAEPNVVLQNAIESAGEVAKSYDDLVARLKKERMTHMTEIPLTWITNRLYLIKEATDLFKEKYRNMTKLFVTQRQAEEIARTLPKRLVDELEWMHVQNITQDINGKQVETQVVKLDNHVSRWGAFNDITENLTHVQRAFASRTKAYHALDAILVSQS